MRFKLREAFGVVLCYVTRSKPTSDVNLAEGTGAACQTVLSLLIHPVPPWNQRESTQKQQSSSEACTSRLRAS